MINADDRAALGRLMDVEHDLSGFTNIARLFPLPGVLMFPHSVLPLHIFEPRYRQMTEDVLAGDRLVTIVQVRQPVRLIAPGTPVIEEVGCVGRIIQHERLPDGKFNYLLLGLRRVRIEREVPSGKLYRTAIASLLDDDYDPEDTSEARAARREELAALFLEVFERVHRVDADLHRLLDTAPEAVLTDVVAHACDLPIDLKQRLLAETRVNVRGVALLEELRMIAAGANKASRPGRFPPPFSVN